MSILVDSHALLWFLAGDSNLSNPARTAIESGGGGFVSMASLWEISIKASLGKLHLTKPFPEIFPKVLFQNGFEIYPIEISHISLLAGLPFHHSDPFDRLLAAQSLASGMPVVSCDKALDAYGIQRIW